MTVTRVNNTYLLAKEYYADVARLDPFQDAAPCFDWTPEAWRAVTLHALAHGYID